MPSVTVKELREQAAPLVGEIRRMSDLVNSEKRDFKPEEKAAWDKANEEYNALAKRIATTERAEAVEAEQRQAGGDGKVGREDHDPRIEKRKKGEARAQATEKHRSLCFRAWAKCQYGVSLRDEERQACKAMRFDPRQQEMRLSMDSEKARRDMKRRALSVHPTQRAAVVAEFRANMSAQVPTSGGYLTAPASLSDAFETNLLAFGGVRNVATEFTTTSGEPFITPTVDDTANIGVQLGENLTIGSGVNPSFAQKVHYAYKFSSTPVLVPSEFLDDDQYDLETELGTMLGMRLGRATAPKYATGSGASTPEGIVTGAALGVTAATATAIKTDEIIRLIHSIDPAYRDQPGAGFLMHDSIVLAIRLLKDGEGRYIWQPGLDTGNPDKILGYSHNVCQEMDSSVASGKKTILFGLLPQYKIRRVNDVRMYRLVERYRDLDQDGFVCFIREDGKLIQAGTNPVKYLLQP